MSTTELRDEQLNIKLTEEELAKVMEFKKGFGGSGVSNSEFGRLAMMYFMKEIEEKGLLKIMCDLY